MRVTVGSALCPEVEEMLTLTGEYSLSIDTERGCNVLGTLLTRCLKSEYLRKLTFLMTKEEIAKEYSVVIPDHLTEQEYYVTDLRSSFAKETYTRYLERYYPITHTYNELYKLKELYSDKWIVSSLIQRTNLLYEDMIESVGPKPVLFPDEVLSQYYEGELPSLEEVDKHFIGAKVHTYSVFWYATKEHPECIAYHLLSTHLPLDCRRSEFERYPFTNPLFPNELVCTTILREYYHLTIEEVDKNIFSKLEGDHKSCLIHTLGKWITELDYSRCVITGGSVATQLLGNPKCNLRDTERLFSFKTDKFRYLTSPTHVSLEDGVATIADRDGVYNYKISPWSDVDICVSDDLEQFARDTYTIVHKYWPNSVLDESESKWTIVSTNMNDYFYGFRNIEMYSKDKYSVVNHHVPPARCYFDGESVYVTPSCKKSLDTYSGKVEVSDIHYFIGKKTPTEIITNYYAKGMQITDELYMCVRTATMSDNTYLNNNIKIAYKEENGF